MSRRGRGQLIAATCWVPSDSSSLVWSASSKNPASFVIQFYVTAIWWLSVFEEAAMNRHHALFVLTVCLYLLLSFACLLGIVCPYIWLHCLNSGTNVCWMVMVNGGSWSLSLPEWWVVPHMATIWYGNPLLRLWMTRCRLPRSDGLHQFSSCLVCRSRQQSPCWCSTGHLSSSTRQTCLTNYPSCCFYVFKSNIFAY